MKHVQYSLIILSYKLSDEWIFGTKRNYPTLSIIIPYMCTAFSLDLAFILASTINLQYIS